MQTERISRGVDPNGTRGGKTEAVEDEAVEIEVVDDRAEPFLRLDPSDARKAAESLEGYAEVNRMIVADGEAEDDWHAAVLEDRANAAEALARRLSNWAEHWEPGGNTW